MGFIEYGCDVYMQYLPPVVLLFRWLLLAVLFQGLASMLGLFFGNWLNERMQVQGCETLCESSLSFFLQGFVILAYTMYLGAQLQ